MTRTVLIMAAGTGGHITPGLAIARELQARGWNVRWLGTTQGMENRLVPKAGFPIDTIEFAGMRGKGLMHALRGLWNLWPAVSSCRRLIEQMKPAVVVGMGGYATVPGGLAARLSGVPLVLMNSDAGLLLSNRLLAPFAKRVLFGFEGSAARRMRNALITGAPVRPEIAALAWPKERYEARDGPLRLLVLGGSLGADIINRTVPRAVAMLEEEDRPIVVHQAGADYADFVRAAYAHEGVKAEVRPFINDMAGVYAQADVVLCRAGALTVSELAVAGVASILVPFEASTTSHQTENAEFLANNKAAILQPQTSFNPFRLSKLLHGLNRGPCLAMAQAARALGRPEATARAADAIEQVALS